MNIWERYRMEFPEAEIMFNAETSIDDKEAEELMEMAIKRGKELTKEERGFVPELNDKEIEKMVKNDPEK